MSEIIERIGVPANPLLPRVLLDERNLTSVLRRIQLDIYKTADALSRFAVTMGDTAEQGDPEGTGELFINKDEGVIYYDAPAKATDPAPAYAWVPLAYIRSDGSVPLTAPWDAVYGITTDYIQLDITYADGVFEGRIQWNNEDGTPEVGMPGGTVVGQLLQELLVRVKNTSGAKIDNGFVVALTGASGHRPEVGLADASVYSKSHAIALATEGIADSQLGFCNIGVGLVRDVDTSAWPPTTALYLSATTPGALTDVMPDAPNTNAEVGFVIYQHATEGSIYFFPNIAPRLIYLSDVDHVAYSDAQFLRWVAANSRFEPGAVTPTDTAMTIYNMTSGSFSGGTYNYFIRYDASGGHGNTVVPTAVGHDGEKLVYKRIDTSSESFVLNFNGGETADGHAEIVMLPGDSYTLVSNGTDWNIK